MKNAHLLSVCLLIFFTGQFANGADLSKIDRTIAKEPAYQNKPKYCLLVFGPEAKTRVWLVQDGGTLYVDRNGNGDLTESGESVAANKEHSTPEEGVYSFEAGDIRDGPLTHKQLAVGISKLDHLVDRDKDVKEYVTKDPKARAYIVRAEVEMPGWKGAGIGGRVEYMTFFMDVNGFLKFGDTPTNTPIIHLGGPWQVTLFGRHELKVGREAEVVLGVGTAGVGPGTTAYVGYENLIPEKAYPKLEMAFPPAGRGESPVTEHYELRQRC